MSENELNVRQEHFARLLFSGRSQTDAYREAYDAHDLAEKSLWESASRLSRNVKVRAYIENLRAEARSETIMGRVELMEWYTEKMRADPDDDADLSTKQIRKGEAAKELAKLGGYYPTEEKEVKVDIVHAFAESQMRSAADEPLVSEEEP